MFPVAAIVVSSSIHPASTPTHTTIILYVVYVLGAKVGIIIWYLLTIPYPGHG